MIYEAVKFILTGLVVFGLAFAGHYAAKHDADERQL